MEQKLALKGLMHGSIGPRAAHLCIDMQNLLGPQSPWHAPWSVKILPPILQLAERRPERTIFTRFVPPPDVESMPLAWRRYYERWDVLTRKKIDPELIELLAPLRAFVPPATVIDKPVYSPFSGRLLPQRLEEWSIDTVIVSGAETDVCVLATVLGAVERGFRVIVAADALCSSSDRTHDALLTFYAERLSIQVELASVEEILAASL
jgi:nicotinamidase-related amidase